MTARLPATRLRSSSHTTPAVRELIRSGIKTIPKIGPTGWVAVVSIVALLLAAYAIHAIVIVATTS